MQLRSEPHISRAAKHGRLVAAAGRVQKRAGGTLDVAIVLGSGLSGGVRSRVDGVEIPYRKLHAPFSTLAGHPGIAYVGAWAGKRVVAFAGRVHLYGEHSVADVTYLVRLAAASGARTIVLTNAAGGLNADFAAGDVMLIRDQINLTGATPLAGRDASAFLDMTGAYASRLRELARETALDVPLREGIYAGVRGPQYETPAEWEAMRRLGADAVGMSTVLETIAARSLGMEVLGLSLITNTAASSEAVSHADVLAASHLGGEKIALAIERFLAAL